MTGDSKRPGDYISSVLHKLCYMYLTIFKQGSHFERCGVEGLGSELQCRGISLHAQWGAQGIVYAIIIMSSIEGNKRNLHQASSHSAVWSTLPISPEAPSFLIRRLGTNRKCRNHLPFAHTHWKQQARSSRWSRVYSHRNWSGCHPQMEQGYIEWH